MPIVLLGLFTVLAAGYGLTIPPGEGVDEIPHFAYVSFVKENRRLPIQPVSRQEGVEVWMGHHPPLYYVMGALAISWIDTSDLGETFRPNPHFVWQENNGSNGWNVMLHFGQDRFPGRGAALGLYWVRLMTTGLGIITLYAILRTGRVMFGEGSWLPLGVTALVAFNPSFVFMNSTIHHDALQAALFALFTWWAIALLGETDRSPGYFVAGGLLAGAAMLTKASGLVLLAVMGLALTLKAYRNHSWRWLVHRAVVTFGTAALVAGWWYVRNLLLYGDPLGWRMFLNIHSHMVRETAYSWRIFVDEFLKQIGRTFWGGFGYMHITFPSISRYFGYGTAAALVGLVAGIATRRFRAKVKWAEWCVLLALLVLLFASFVRFSAATIGAGHARYLFPAAFTMAALMVVGLNGLFGWRFQREVSLVIAIALFAYAVWLPIRHVLPKYEPPATISYTQVPGQGRVVNAQVAAGLKLVAYSSRIETAAPGRDLPIMLYWQAVGDPGARLDPKIRLALRDEQGAMLAQHEAWPVPSAPPSVWSEDRLYVSQALLQVPRVGEDAKVSLTIAPLLKSGQDYIEGDSMSVGEVVLAKGGDDGP